MVQGSPELAKQLAAAIPASTSWSPRRRSPTRSSASRYAQRRQDDAGPGRQEGKVRRGGRLLPGRRRRSSAFSWSPSTTRPNGPGAPMKKMIEDEYRSMLKAAGIVENFPRHDYVGGTAGATLRRRRDLQDAATPTRTRSGPPPSTPRHSTASSMTPSPTTIFDAECVSCHTTGLRVQLGLAVRGLDALPEGQPVRELPRPGLEARRRTR